MTITEFKTQTLTERVADWTQTYADRTQLTNKTNADNMVKQTGKEGKNGGFIGATVVTE